MYMKEMTDWHILLIMIIRFDQRVVFYIPDEWYMFDDDNVTCVTAEDVLKLSGGGNSINHTSLLSFLIRHIPFTFQNMWDALNKIRETFNKCTGQIDCIYFFKR